jgi:hypothetical protein
LGVTYQDEEINAHLKIPYVLHILSSSLSMIIHIPFKNCGNFKIKFSEASQAQLK